MKRPLFTTGRVWLRAILVLPHKQAVTQPFVCWVQRVRWQCPHSCFCRSGGQAEVGKRFRSDKDPTGTRPPQAYALDF